MHDEVTRPAALDRGTTQRDALDGVTTMLRTLADRTRLKILLLLGGGKLNVTEISRRSGCDQPSVSHHLGLLRRSSLVESRRDGKMVFYGLSGIASVPAPGTLRVEVIEASITIRWS